MHILKVTAIATLIAVGLSGCETYRSVTGGHPDVSDGVLLIPAIGTGQDPAAVCKSAADTSADCMKARRAASEPAECKDSDDFTSSDSDKLKIKRCTQAVRLLIDRQYMDYRHEIYALATTSTTLADSIISGAGVAGTLTAPGTTKVLSAIIAGLNGLKATADQDLLYKNSILLILLQMDKDRASKATVIQKALNDGSYQSMPEASADLFEYFVAGTWDDAILRMQSDAGAQDAACQTAYKNAKLTGTTALATPTAPCGEGNSQNAGSVPDPVTIGFLDGQTVPLDATKNANAIGLIEGAAATFNGAALSLTRLELQGTVVKDGDPKKADPWSAAVNEVLIAKGVNPKKIVTKNSVAGTSNGVVISFVGADGTVVAAKPPQNGADSAPDTTPLYGTLSLTAGTCFVVKATGSIIKISAPASAGNISYLVFDPASKQWSEKATTDPVKTLLPTLTAIVPDPAPPAPVAPPAVTAPGGG